MKITRKQLKQIIKEEIGRVLEGEFEATVGDDFIGDTVVRKMDDLIETMINKLLEIAAADPNYPDEENEEKYMNYDIPGFDYDRYHKDLYNYWNNLLVEATAPDGKFYEEVKRRFPVVVEKGYSHFDLHREVSKLDSPGFSRHRGKDIGTSWDRALKHYKTEN